MNYKFLFLILLCALQSLAQKNNTIGFTENKGQIVDQKGKENKSVLYLLNTHGLNVQLKKNGFSYDVYEVQKHPLSEKQKQELYPNSISNSKEEQPGFSLEYIYHRIDIDFVNSNSDVRLISEEKSVDYDNYYNVVHAPNGITNVHKYQKVTYKNIYDNIDVAFFIPKDSTKAVEYNFIVKPEGKISDIQLKFNGAKTELADNKIKMQVRFGEMEETLPLSWTEQGTAKKEIVVGYKKIKKNVYGFDGEVIASDKTIVIDPTPVRLWGTYYGGSAYDFNTSTVKVDNSDNVYLTGQTVSLDNIATAGAFLTTISYPIISAYLGKLDANGMKLWGTYVHNYNPNIPINETAINDIVINSSYEIYIVGVVRDKGEPNNITTPNSHKEFGSSTDYSTDDGFIIKFNSFGQRIWGTLFGGEGSDKIKTVSLDSQENLIIAGETNSFTGISTPNSFQTDKAANYGSSGFFSKFSPSGNQLYGSYFPREIYESTIDTNGNIIFAGQYEIANYYPDISTPGAHQTQTNYEDGFIIKFNSSFNRLWCTYYGGVSVPATISPFADVITGISTDANNNIYICGYTNSVTGIATPGAYKETHTDPNSSTEVDAFLAKFNPQGVRQWGTFFGDNYTISDKCYDGIVTANGDFYIVGETNSPNNIATPGSYQPNINSYNDGFIGKFNTNGQIAWSTYFGGPTNDAIYNIDVKNNVIYISGITNSYDSISTPGTHKTSVEGGDAFVEKFMDCNSLATTISSNSPICIGNTIQLNATGGTNYSWSGPNNFSSADQNPVIANANASHSGVYTCVITNGGCGGPTSTTVTVGNTSPPVPNVATLPNITGDCNTTVSPPTATTCTGIINATTANPLTYPLPGTYTIVWAYTDGNGNTATQNQTVIISSQPLPAVTSPQIFCVQQPATLNDIVISGQNIKWYDAVTGGNLLLNTTSLQNNGTYYASQTIGGCESNRISILVNIQDTPAPTGTLLQSFCTNSNPTLSTIAVTGNTITWYDSAAGGSILPITTPLTDGMTYYASQTINGCASPVRLAVTISMIDSLPSNNYAVSLCDNLNDSSESVNLTSYNADLIANPANYSFSYYNTLNGAENQDTADLINSASSYTLAVGFKTIFVRITSPNGCSSVVTLTLTLLQSPILTLANDYYLCKNSVLTINGTAGFDTYLWSDGSTGHSIVINQAGVYTLTVTKNHNTPSGIITCSNTKSFTVVLSDIATVSEIVTSDWTNDQNTITVLLTESSVGDYVYSLDGEHYQTSNTFVGLESGEYTVFIKDKHECGVQPEDFYLLMYPKFFTPNGDSFNDFWKIKFSDNEPDLTVKIVDRYGKFITQFGVNSAGWDGTYDGVPAVATDYWFIVTRQNGTEHKGHFSLKR